MSLRQVTNSWERDKRKDIVDKYLFKKQNPKSA